MFGILDYIKIGAGAAVGILVTTVYWTGLPLLNDLPILNKIPIIGQMAVGHVETVKEEARAGYVILAEKTAAEATTAKIRRQLTAATAANTTLLAAIQADALSDT